MMVDWNKVFDNFGIKKVSKTDKTKSAYLPNEKQRLAIEAAGILPADERPAPSFEVTVLFDPATPTILSSYYYSERSPDAERNPEPRMGHGIISSWLAQGDKVLIGNIGSQLFVAKLDFAPISQVAASQEIIKRANRQVIFDRAIAATGKPPKRPVERAEFIRNPYIVAAVLLRSDGKCEMPDCSRELFTRDDDSTYLEVHHVVPLSEEGDDTFINAAALCPHCHREVHHGKNRHALRNKLRVYIEAMEA
ncbi:HNH endonuclease [Cellvibrio fibrivorans]|uniref:5-methylcytosine-specific restriction endonuclease McrA n=1 Tax=Cellvibrio fibrivorans TaxID=126350 RepID=A0ABU1UUW0_9GAMM|nr:HNH endonuclease signature motif containing protein [Cellvibrio fibrivorans]MDR7088969.1 5-methylcytosine-specific restriction endonuclease McrA [Cellvibrio fibrivorans]